MGTSSSSSLANRHGEISLTKTIISNFLRDTQALLTIKQRQYSFLDALRGVTIISMISWHFVYDLAAFGHIARNFIWHPEVVAWQQITMNLFIFLFGLSLSLAHVKGFEWKTYIYRTLMLAAAACLVTLATLVAYTDRWVYFGILHFFTLCSLMILPFIGRPWLSLLTALIIVICHYGWNLTIPWFTMSHVPFDLVRPFPYFAYALFGIFAYRINFHKIFQGARFPTFFIYLGQHSLIIYLLHLPLLFGIFTVVRML